jgi:hypothetical protein
MLLISHQILDYFSPVRKEIADRGSPPAWALPRRKIPVSPSSILTPETSETHRIGRGTFGAA